MSLREIIKELLFVNQKDYISKRFLMTNKSSYKDLMNGLEKNKSTTSTFIEEELIQEFEFTAPLVSGEGDTECRICQFSFTNISVGSTHIRDLHDIDLKVISKLALLELLVRSNIGNDLYKNVNQTDQVPCDKILKPFDLSKILTKDKEFNGVEIKIPFFLAIIFDKIYKDGLFVEGIFRKSVSEIKLKKLFEDLSDLLNNDSNNIDKIYNLLCIVDVEIIASLLKVFIRNIRFIIPTNVVKLLLGVPDIKSDKKTILFYQCLMLQIPEPKRVLLEIIIDLLSQVVSNHKINKIDLCNAAILFAPVLFSVNDIESNKSIIRVLQQMIHYSRLIFLVPRNVIKEYRNDNESNNVTFQAHQCIGKHSRTTKGEAIILCNYKHTVYSHTCQDHTNSPKLENNVFMFKYKKQTKYFSYNKETKIEELLRTVDGSVESCQLRLVETYGNIYQCSLHPETNLESVRDGNTAGFFSVLSVTKTDIVKSTIHELYRLLGISLPSS